MEDITHVLIVDDEEIICQYLADILSGSGFQVFSTCYPVEALRLARQRHFDLAILDIMMPRMDGFALARELRGIHGSMGVIFLTGFGNLENALKAIRLGVSDFIEKPFKVDELLISVNRVAESLRLEREVQAKSRLLRKSEEQYRILVENLADGVALFSEGRLVFQNRAFSELLGLESMSLDRRAMVELLHPQDRIKAIQDAMKLLKGQPCGPVRYRFRRRDGTYRWVSVNSALIHFKGRSGVISTFRDITPLLEMEMVRRDMERMLRHDMRSSLVAIVGLANRLLNRTELTETQEKYCRQIEASGRQLEKMVETYLDVARLEQGSFKPQRERFNFLDLVAQSRRTLRDLADRKNVDLVIIFNKALYALEHELPFVGDRLYLQNAVDNLVKNAIEASPQNRTVKIKVQSDVAKLTVSVHNWGAVPEEVRSCFFEKYSTHGKKNGTGLGTYMAHLVVTNHGGTITVETTEDDATVVHIELPIEPA